MSQRLRFVERVAHFVRRSVCLQLPEFAYNFCRREGPILAGHGHPVACTAGVETLRLVPAASNCGGTTSIHCILSLSQMLPSYIRRSPGSDKMFLRLGVIPIMRVSQFSSAFPRTCRARPLQVARPLCNVH